MVTFDEFANKVDSIIPPSTSEKFTPTRFPFTYAYDFVRAHHKDLEIEYLADESDGSRGDTAKVIKRFCEENSLSRRTVVTTLAYAYCLYYDLYIDSEVLGKRMSELGEKWWS